MTFLYVYLAVGLVTNVWFAYDFWRYEPKDYGRDWSDWLIAGNPVTFGFWPLCLPGLVARAVARHRAEEPQP